MDPWQLPALYQTRARGFCGPPVAWHWCRIFSFTLVASRVELRAVTAGGSSGGLCRGWQLFAELANEKNGLFSRVGQPIYVFRLLECLGSPEEYCIAILVPRLFHLILKECRATPLRITPSPSRPPAKFRDGRWRFAGRWPDSLLRPTCRVPGSDHLSLGCKSLWGPLPDRFCVATRSCLDTSAYSIQP